MPYPEQLVAPMREELTRLEVKELTTGADVESFFSGLSKDETTVLIINSVCGCAAANARPAVALAKQAGHQPNNYATVFAGQDLEATAAARVVLAGIPQSSPFIAVLKGTEPVFVLERRHIEGRTAGAIATDLVQAFEALANGQDPTGATQNEAIDGESPLPPTFRSIL